MTELSTTLVVSFLLAFGAPLAAASHWTLHEVGLGAPLSATGEDDGEVVRQPDNQLDGLVNRVVASGARPGDGSLFLDAVLGNAVASFDAYPDRFVAEPGVFSTLLLPGALRGSAWYGEWRDLDGDGVIDDVHDAACAGSACPIDEFAWRGLASNEQISMTGALLPNSAGTPEFYGGGLADSRYYETYPFADGTARDRPNQEWTSAKTFLSGDGGFLATVQTFVIASDKKSAGGVLGYDADDPSTRYDVDTYEALSPDVAPLWGSAVDVAKSVSAGTVLDLANQATRELVGNVSALVTPHIPEAPGDAGVGSALAEVSGRANTPYAKEPNTEFDDFEGRAQFGGFGDTIGSFNAYDAYAHGFHFFFDTIPRIRPCAAVHVVVPGSSIATTSPGTCVVRATDSAEHTDVVGANGPRARTATAELSFESHAVLWHDRNLDTHVGAVCDRESVAFDPERNTCAPDGPGYPSPYAQDMNGGETVKVCEASSSKGGSILLTPIGGAWPGVIIVRDAEAFGRAGESSIEVRTDAEPIKLRWMETCSGTYKWDLYSRDAILFPTPMSVPIRVDAESSITGFSDQGRGIEIGPERVLDVDFLAPPL